MRFRFCSDAHYLRLRTLVPGGYVPRFSSSSFPTICVESLWRGEYRRPGRFFWRCQRRWRLLCCGPRSPAGAVPSLATCTAQFIVVRRAASHTRIAGNTTRRGTGRERATIANRQEVTCDDDVIRLLQRTNHHPFRFWRFFSPSR